MELVRSLIDQLDERTREVQGLKTKLQDLQSELQSTGDRENFIMSELAAQVHDLNCKYSLCRSVLVFVRPYRNVHSLEYRYPW